MANLIADALARIDRLPAFLRNWATNQAFGRAVPYVRTSRIRYESVSEREWVASVPNVRPVQNHIRQVHAGAMIVAAESVAVTMMAMSLPPDRLPVVKTIEAKFIKKSAGRITATARLTEEQLELIRTAPKGEVTVEVEMRDESGEPPVLITVVPAWYPKKQ